VHPDTAPEAPVSWPASLQETLYRRADLEIGAPMSLHSGALSDCGQAGWLREKQLAAVRTRWQNVPMCNRVVQKGKIIKPGERITVRMKGPGAEFELEFDGAVFGGPAKRESRGYWKGVERAEEVIIPHVSRFGEKNKVTGEQNWEDVADGSSLEGLLLPQPPGKDYRLLKVVTQPATAEQAARMGNDRAPIVLPPPLQPAR